MCLRRVVAILGPTASGKTDLAIEVAQRLGGEVISVDSMQVYRDMDIGTAKPSVVERRGVRHHMLDVVNPENDFSVAEFRHHGRTIMEAAEVPLVIAGGSGLHYRALVDPLSFAPTDASLRRELEDLDLDELVAELVAADPLAGTHLDLANPRRVLRAVEVVRLTGETPSLRAGTSEAEDIRTYKPEIEFTAVGVDPGDQLDKRVDQRLMKMKEAGLVEEVKSLKSRLGRAAGSAVGYREILTSFGGAMPLDHAFQAIARNTKKLAKKQRTWFRRDPRIRWIPWHSESDERIDLTLEAMT